MTDTHEKTLREHMADAGRARWAGKTVEERKAHASNMARARWAKTKRTPQNNTSTESASTGGNDQKT